MRRDLVHALRALRRAPALALVGVLTLALAIGSATAVFSVVDAVVLRGLPYRDAGQLRAVYERSEDGNLRVPSYPTFRDWQTASAALRGTIDGLAFVRGDGTTVGASHERQIVAYVSPGFFHMMGTRALLGRTFTSDEDSASAARVGVLSYDAFMRQFGGDRSIIGKTVAVDSVPTTIVGVMPSGFAYPNFGGGGWLPPALWQPISVFASTHQALSLRGLHVDSRAILRVHPGADSARVAAAMHTIEQRLAAEFPAEQAHWTSVALATLPSELFGELWSTLALIAGAIALVLLLACASVANLLLIRASARSREFALRAALGASRWRVAKQPLLESAAIAVGGGGAGLALAMLLVHVARPFANQRLPFATHITIDPHAVLFTVGVTALTAILIGALAALQASRENLVERLRGGAMPTGGAAEVRVRNGLVAMQFALAMTLLVGAGLLIQSVRRLTDVPLGYDPTGLASFAISPPAHRYDAPAQAAALYARVIDAVRAVPSVRSAAAAGGALLPTKIDLAGRAASSASVTAAYHPISADYLRTMGLRIVAGRGFTDDDMRAPNGLLVTDTLAKQLWPGASAVGQRITIYRQSQARPDFGKPITMPVVGVVSDYHDFGPESPATAEVFLPYTLEVWPWMTFVARAGTSPAVLASIERAVRGVDPALSFFAEPSFDDSGRAPSLTDPRMFVTGLLSAFAAVALLLAAVGLYGVVTYAMAQRTREIGIRIAIGATTRHIVRLTMRQSASYVLAGIVVGTGGAYAGTRVLRALLFQTAPTDAVTFAVVPIVLAAVALFATTLPALRAARTDPAIVIRAE
ncbi:MAG TPA: ADOP family duplicated permease [Gemmatimonadaceae bacterium]|nr:ADOP family duplicated permease [Gemmatimonadaceae bacterium]